MILTENSKLTVGVVPVSFNGGKAGEYVSLKNYNRCRAILIVGAAAATCHVTLYRATDVSATGATTVELPYWYNLNVPAYNGEDATATDTLTAQTTADSSFTLGSTANSMYVWDFAAVELGAYDCFSLVASDEFFADDVKCSHGATIGQLDNDAMFYLKSRGIGIDAARAILMHAFASDVVRYIKINAVRDYVEGILKKKFHEE